ncbi:hypothetical protein POM88_053931 [Heracleum sosnowskyi]|uniref:Myb/SANT-like domain-containing protein n=1 Tax=Heracleum sosnowskyi TaxID=360622 RepID=A0AAD8GPU9_9APIA|nr:hypothetical protein POM88_053931 [Heracleum sosnowskyi]
MADSQSAKKRSGYDQWSKDESDGLLELMVDAANRGWRDNNGRYNFYSTLLNFSSGFGYDSTSKKFTAPNEVWDEYIKAHPKDGYMRYEAFDDYEDLKIAIGNGVAVGKNSIGLGSSTEARTLEAGEMRDLRIDDLAFDVDSEVFVLEQNDPSPKGSPEVFEALNTIAPQMMVKPGGISPKISESTRFYPYFKDCVGAIDGTHIPATMKGRDEKWVGNSLRKILSCCHPRNANELFNLRHSSLRNVIERIFECRSDEFPIEVEDVQPSDMEDGGNDGSNFSSQQQQRAEANTWTTNIANSPWNDRPRTTTNEEDDDDQYNENEEHVDDED